MTVKNIESSFKSKEFVDPEKHWPQIVAILIGSITGFTDGLLFAWTSPFLLVVLEDPAYDVTDGEASFFTTIHALGQLAGCFVFSMLSDLIGRKKSLCLTALLQLVALLSAAFARDKWLFYLSRFSGGMSNGCFFAVLTIYVGEIANPSVRGRWGSVLATSMYVGELVLNALGSCYSIAVTSYLCLPFPILFFLLFSLMPESPYWLIIKEREDDAKEALAFLTRKNNIEPDFVQLRSDVHRQMSESGSWLDLLKIRSNRRALIAGIFLRFTQQTSGLGIFLFYTQLIFKEASGNLGDKISYKISSILYTGLNIIFSIVVMIFIIHRFHRKTLYITSHIFSAIVLYTFATYLCIKDKTDIDVSSVTWIPFTCILLQVVALSFGISVIPTLMLSELFSVKIKAKAMVFSLVLLAIGNVIVNECFYYLRSNFGFFAPFYFFAVCNTVAAIGSYFIIPETKGKTLEEIQQILKK